VRWAAALAALWLCAGCFGGGSTTETENDPQVLRFAQRIDRFYRQLENLPLDVRLTFEDTSLRAYFSDGQQFSAYYASLADQIRKAQFRNSTALRVDIGGFRFEADDRAVVDLTLVGRHERTLRVGELEITRTDTWRLVEGRWMVSPAKL
jgi:hypothetical protein